MGSLKKTDKGRLRQAKSSFPSRTCWEVLYLSQEPACGEAAALTKTMVTWGMFAAWRVLLTNAGGNDRTVIVVKCILISPMIRNSVYQSNGVVNLLSSQAWRRPIDNHARAFADQKAAIETAGMLLFALTPQS